MNRSLLILVLSTLSSLVLVACSVTPQPPPAAPPSPLQELLRYVPDEPGYRRYVTYGDAAAWHAAWDVPRIDNREELDALGQPRRNYWIFPLLRETAPPDTLGLNYLFVDDMRASHGFDFYLADRYLLAGEPPDWLTVVEHHADPAGMAAALKATGYTETPLGSQGTLYSIGDDYKIDLNFPIQAGRTGNLNRVALLDGRLLLAKATGVMERAQQARSGAKPSLAQAAEYRAAVAALADASLADTGELVGALILPGDSFTATVKGASPAVQERVRAQLDEWAASAPLPRATLVAFGTRDKAASSALILAAVFPAGTDAAAAAQSLAARLKEYNSLVTGKPIDRWTFDRAAGIEAAGLPVALVVMRAAPTVTERSVAIRNWFDIVARRDTVFLVPGP